MKNFERPRHASPEINRLEAIWWEENASLIARVWEMYPEVSAVVRGQYMQSARQFLLGDATPARVLELGCGSGWVGQMIAGADLQIIGTDFSSAQIELARANASSRGLGDACKYAVQSDKEIPDEIESCDGLLLHCFLHHLDGAELEALLDALTERVRPGTRIWIYEPAFHTDAQEGESNLSPELRGQLDVVVRQHEQMVRLLGERNLLDKPVRDRFQTLQEIANRSHWYLSPKEVPLDLRAFTKMLEDRWHVVRSAWETVNLVGWAHDFNTITDSTVRHALVRDVLPVWADVDRAICAEDAYLAHFLRAPNYAFRSWECVAEKASSVRKYPVSE